MAAQDARGAYRSPGVACITPAVHVMRQTAAMHTREQTQQFTRHRVRLLLPALLAVSLTYPVVDLHTGAAVAYVVVYVVVLALAARVAAVTRARQVTATTIAALIALLSVPWILWQNLAWLSLVVYGLLVIFHGVVIVTIFQYLLEVQQVDIDVLSAGTSLYVLIGNMFIPAIMIADLLTEVLSGTSAYVVDGGVTWQQMAYFSFSTLTTLGYGDIRPVTPTAQALAIAEAIMGVLTVALIIGRLVGAATRRQARR